MVHPAGTRCMDASVRRVARASASPPNAIRRQSMGYPPVLSPRRLGIVLCLKRRIRMFDGTYHAAGAPSYDVWEAFSLPLLWWSRDADGPRAIYALESGRYDIRIPDGDNVPRRKEKQRKEAGETSLRSIIPSAAAQSARPRSACTMAR